MTLFTTSIRLIKATITGAIGGAKDAVLLERQFMAWESELEELEVFDGYQGWIEVEDDDIPVSYQRDCICCDNLYGTPTHGMLMCDHCLSQDDQIDELPDFLKEHKCSEYHMDTCCIEATGTCNCELPF